MALDPGWHRGGSIWLGVPGELSRQWGPFARLLQVVALVQGRVGVRVSRGARAGGCAWRPAASPQSSGIGITLPGFVRSKSSASVGLLHGPTNSMVPLTPLLWTRPGTRALCPFSAVSAGGSVRCISACCSGGLHASPRHLSVAQTRSERMSALRGAQSAVGKGHRVSAQTQNRYHCLPHCLPGSPSANPLRRPPRFPRSRSARPGCWRAGL